jgi:hypothetical protein
MSMKMLKSLSTKSRSRSTSVRKATRANRKAAAQMFNAIRAKRRLAAVYLPIPKGHCYIEGNLVKRIIE